MGWDDVLIDGTSLSTFGAIEDFAEILKCAPLRGSNIVIPGAAGSVHTAKVRGAFVVTVRLALWDVTAETFGGVVSRLAALRALLDTSAAPVTLTRRFTLVDGTQVAQDAQVDVLEVFAPELVGTTTSRVAVDVEVLSGWEDLSP